MKSLKKILLFGLFLPTFSMVAQSNNAFLDRAFWKNNPDVEAVKNKIKEGNDPTALNSNAFDAVVYALLEKADDNVIAYLLSLEGNPVDKNTHDSRIYLHWAAYAGKIEMVSYLLEKGSSVTDLDSHGYTPLAFAANSGQKNPELYNTFEKHGINLTKEKSDQGANLLLLVAPSLNSEKELKFFLNKGLKLDSKDDSGNGIFNYAAKKGNTDFLDLLIKKGGDYKTLNKEGANAFLFASQGGRGFSNPLSVYEYLKKLGLDPNMVTKDGYTPLHRLAYNNTDKAIFELFLSAGADVNQKDANGNTPFLNAAARNNMGMVKLLSEDVSDFNTANANGQTALMLATENNTPEVVGYLLAKGADALVTDNMGNSIAYYWAASFSDKDAEAFEQKKILFEKKGVVFNNVQADGNTLYHLAAKNNNVSLAKKLEGFGIDLNAKNDEGLTALHLAAMKAENDGLMKYLISIGADVKIKTDFEETVYDLASENELLQKQNIGLNFLK
ncbi:MAG: ankyrin repeat domain-containing protein [Algicola sp.]|nr:ankyrin repeat domain-containing protein [Algicola sp.]